MLHALFQTLSPSPVHFPQIEQNPPQELGTRHILPPLSSLVQCSRGLLRRESKCSHMILPAVTAQHFFPISSKGLGKSLRRSFWVPLDPRASVNSTFEVRRMLLKEAST